MIFASTKPGQIPQTLDRLTAVRFFAALAVVVFHIFDTAPWLSHWGETVLRKGSLGVDLFFILSGFILAHVYLDRFEAGRLDYRDFLVKRIARIYPAHITMMAVFLLVYTAVAIAGFETEGRAINWAHLPFHLTMTHAWGFLWTPAWNYPSWSISAEWFAYLLFPVYLTLATRLGPKVTLAVSVIGFWLLFFLVFELIGRRLTGLAYQFGILRILFEFMMGVALCQILRHQHLTAAASRAVLWGSLGAIAACVVLDISDMILVPLFGGLLFALACREIHAPAKGRLTQILVYLGEISYSTYMVHALLVILAQAIAPKLGVASTDALPALILIAAIYAASAMLYHGVELPMRAWIQARARGARPATTPAGD